jgi:hypothetical protein
MIKRLPEELILLSYQLKPDGLDICRVKEDVQRIGLTFHEIKAKLAAKGCGIRAAYPIIIKGIFALPILKSDVKPCTKQGIVFPRHERNAIGASEPDVHIPMSALKSAIEISTVGLACSELDSISAFGRGTCDRELVDTYIGKTRFPEPRSGLWGKDDAVHFIGGNVCERAV